MAYHNNVSDWTRDGYGRACQICGDCAGGWEEDGNYHCNFCWNITSESQAEEEQNKTQQLVAMGFSFRAAKRALRENRGEVEAVVKMISLFRLGPFLQAPPTEGKYRLIIIGTLS